MIRIKIKEPRFEDWGDHNPYMAALEAWHFWGSNLGLTWLPAGSHRTTIEPGTWFIQTYNPADRTSRFADGRFICFHESDRRLAIMFKLAWV